MKITNLILAQAKFDINLKFYFFLKTLVKTGFTASQIGFLLGRIKKHKKSIFELFADQIYDDLNLICKPTKKNSIPKKIVDFAPILELILKDADIDLLSFSLKLIAIKEPLLSEAKLTSTILNQELESLDPLSLSYDQKSVFSPYATRVNGALLSLLLFDKVEKEELNFVSSDTTEFVFELVNEAKKLQKIGLEPNQIFMLMFSESINQSIISDSGIDYETRILQTLITIGIPRASITKEHDKSDASTEFDFYFELEGLTFGIGAKRTLRERYKQFIKTALSSDIDVMIEFTIGLDLNEAKANTIVAHGTILFVADEIYQSREFLQKMNGVFSAKEFNLETLMKIAKKAK